MKSLAFFISYNSPGKQDGAWFRHNARRFAKRWDIPRDDVIPIGQGAGYLKRDKVLRALADRAGEGYEQIAFFCHGWRSGIQVGFNLETAGALAAAIAGCAAPGVRVLLYACSTADGGVKGKAHENGDAPAVEGGFLSALSASFDYVGLAARCIGHETAGDATTNPYVVSCDPEGCRSYFWEPRSTGWDEWRMLLVDTDLDLELGVIESVSFREDGMPFVVKHKGHGYIVPNTHELQEALDVAQDNRGDCDSRDPGADKGDCEGTPAEASTGAGAGTEGHAGEGGNQAQADYRGTVRREDSAAALETEAVGPESVLDHE